MQVICINDRFPVDYQIFYIERSITTPVRNELYSIRDIIKTIKGDYAFLLEEIVNKKVFINHPILGTAEVEPSWGAHRFTDLNGKKIDMLELYKSFQSEYCKSLTYKTFKQ